MGQEMAFSFDFVPSILGSDGGALLAASATDPISLAIEVGGPTNGSIGADRRRQSDKYAAVW
jgi:hypothetical protein